jgi:hypothetical protein
MTLAPGQSYPAMRRQHHHHARKRARVKTEILPFTTNYDSYSSRTGNQFNPAVHDGPTGIDPVVRHAQHEQLRLAEHAARLAERLAERDARTAARDKRAVTRHKEEHVKAHDTASRTAKATVKKDRALRAEKRKKAITPQKAA